MMPVLALLFSSLLVLGVLGWVAYQEVDQRFWRQARDLDDGLWRAVLMNAPDRDVRAARVLLMYSRPHPITRRTLPDLLVTQRILRDRYQVPGSASAEVRNFMQAGFLIRSLNGSHLAQIVRTGWPQDVQVAAVLAGLTRAEVIEHRQAGTMPEVESLRMIAALNQSTRNPDRLSLSMMQHVE